MRVRGEEEDRTYIIPYGARINVKEGDQVFAGGQITRGPLNPHDILRLNGVEGVYQYLLKEVQRVYKQQGVDINDKHVEVIVSQMLSKYKIEDAGDTDLLPGGLYGKFEIEEANAKALEEGGEPCVTEENSPGYHQGIAGDQLLPVRGVLPGNDQSPDRCGDQGQER